jgi:hypothetical protein
MCSITTIILYAFITRAHAAEHSKNAVDKTELFADKVIDKLVDKLVDKLAQGMGSRAINSYLHWSAVYEQDLKESHDKGGALEKNAKPSNLRGTPAQKVEKYWWPVFTPEDSSEKVEGENQRSGKLAWVPLKVLLNTAAAPVKVGGSAVKAGGRLAAAPVKAGGRLLGKPFQNGKPQDSTQSQEEDDYLTQLTYTIDHLMESKAQDSTHRQEDDHDHMSQMTYTIDHLMDSKPQDSILRQEDNHDRMSQLTYTIDHLMDSKPPKEDKHANADYNSQLTHTIDHLMNSPSQHPLDA